jgi:hypothetical protein
MNDKEKKAEEIATQLAKNPTILSSLQNRLETEEPQDWEDEKDKRC